jgi:hypothetical protein
MDPVLAHRRCPREPGACAPGRRRSMLSSVVIAVAGLALGCSGSISGGSNGGDGKPGAGNSAPGGGNNSSGGTTKPGGSNTGGGSTTPGGGNSSGGSTPGGTPGALNVGYSTLRRLNTNQYRNTVSDLLGIKDVSTLIPATALPSDGSLVERFASNNTSAVQGLDADKYAGLAETLARQAITNLTGLVACDPKAMGDATCATQFIKSFGKRAFRRPLTAVEEGRYQKVFMAGGQFANGIRLLVQAFLQSPNFLYLVEPVAADAAGKIFAVDSWVMASRLSYFFLDSMPDAELFTAADAGQLSTVDQVGKQANRLMADPRFAATVNSFHGEWLELDNILSAEKDPALFPMWNDGVKSALDEQTSRFVDYAVRQGDGKLETLLKGSFTFMNAPLYDLYGLPKPAGASATTWQKVDLDPKQRAGILTQAGVLAGLAHENRTSFILRGKLIREAILCTDVPSPPPGVDASETNIPPTATAKQRSEMHRKDPSCAGCHGLFDPLGFGFESFDAVGRYRTKDAAGAAIDTAVTITGTEKLDGTAADGVELAAKLANAEEVRACVAKQWMRFGLGRLEDKDADAGSLNAALQAMMTSNGKISDLLVALAQSDAFRHQKVSQ